jgi:hypothetical protein
VNTLAHDFGSLFLFLVADTVISLSGLGPPRHTHDVLAALTCS